MTGGPEQKLYRNSYINQREILEVDYLERLHCYTQWSLRAFEACKNGSDEQAIWAMINIADFIEEELDRCYDVPPALEFYPDSMRDDLFFWHARLAKVFKENNEIDKYSEHVSKALEIAQKVFPGKYQSEADLLSIFDESETNFNENTD